MSDHIPDPGQHRTILYGEYSSRARGTTASDTTPTTADPPPRRRCSASWARMIAKIYHVDPLVCVRCGQRMSILAFVSDQHAIGRILEHLGVPASWDGARLAGLPALVPGRGPLCPQERVASPGRLVSHATPLRQVCSREKRLAPPPRRDTGALIPP